MFVKSSSIENFDIVKSDVHIQTQSLTVYVSFSGVYCFVSGVYLFVCRQRI